MSKPSDPTLAFYAREAVAYAARPSFVHGRSRSASDSARRMDTFLAALPARGDVLELGCGGGDDTLAMRRQGFNVRPTDGTPEMAAEAARRLGQPVDVLLFQDLSDVARYDGVWANACLLHVPRPSFDKVLGRIQRALRPNGALYCSFKAGETEGFDSLGRYYNYPDEAWLRARFEAGAWREVSIEAAQGGGYDKVPTPWLHVMARKAPAVDRS